MWNNLERRFGRFAIPRLMNYIIGGYAIGYLLYFMYRVTGLNYLAYLALDPYQILHITNGIPVPQVWRLITWVLIPPFGFTFMDLIFGAIMMVFYWQLGNVLERSWGTFRFNCFIFGGIILTILFAFALYGIDGSVYPVTMQANAAPLAVWAYSFSFTTNYINMSIFLAFAICYPDMTVMLYFILPIKMKWMAILYAVITGYELITGLTAGNFGRVAVILGSLVNFGIFYLSTRDFYRVSPRQVKRRATFRKQTAETNNPFAAAQGSRQGYRHKCCICGRTDVTNPELTFRYCSKCKGNREYCEDHLFTHTHVQ